MRRSLAVLSFGLLLAACDLAEEPYRPQLVVDAILYANEPFPAIRLAQTFPIANPTPPSGGGVAGAVVVIERLGPDGEPDQVVPYLSSLGFPGTYTPLIGSSERVTPLGRYRLTIRVPEHLDLVSPGALVVGETVVPDTFRVVEPPPESISYQPLSPSPTLRVTRSAYPGRQSIFLFSIIAQDPSFGLTPTYAELVDPEDAGRLVENTSPLLNEASYDVNPDGTLTLRIPWLAIAFYGPNQFIAQALDDASYDFIRSRDAQFGGSTLSPGEIPEVLTNLTNAVGVFGSAARQSVEIFVEE